MGKRAVYNGPQVRRFAREIIVMFFGKHLTTKAERDALIASPGEKMWINPADFHGFRENKPIVLPEGETEFFDHSDTLKDFFEILEMLQSGQKYNYEDTKYFKRWQHKGTEVHTRLQNLPTLFNSIRMEGVKEPVHCEATGERLDGSFRTKIAMFLGHEKVPAIMHRWKWQDVNDELLTRLIKGRWLSGGKEYYQFPYGNGWWNVPEGGDIYKENAERADVIVPLIEGDTVLDVGCNEGYISLKTAMTGKDVVGVDIDYIHGANLNKLVFEHVQKKAISAQFFSHDISSMEKLPHRQDPYTVLFLNVLYHLKTPVKVLKRFRGSQVIIQCNLRKNVERHRYFGAHPEDAKALIEMAGMRVIKAIDWRDKPILIAGI